MWFNATKNELKQKSTLSEVNSLNKKKYRPSMA